MRITICGDVCAHFTADYFRNNQIDFLFNSVTNELKNSTRSLFNLESAITERETPIKKKGPNLKSPIETAKVLKEVGFTDCGVSNNHFFDYGYEGVADTMLALKQAGINATGFGANYEGARKDLIIEENGIKVAIIAVCEHEYSFALENRAGTRVFDPFDTIIDIREAKKTCDKVIVTYHGGKEYSIYPSPRLRKACKAMVKAGADVVLCQHSHCIGCYEKFEGATILYGQGNFHFTGDGDTDPLLQTGLIVHIDIESEVSVSFVPTVVLENGISIDVATGEQRQKILQKLEEDSLSLHNGVWREQWREFCLSIAERYYGNIERAYTSNAWESDNEIFNGRMHCEAHKDVIDELFKHSWEERENP